MKAYRNIIFFMLAIVTGCKDKYMPQLRESPMDILVVEGFINVGAGATTIRMSRTRSLDSVYYLAESGAQVEVQTDNGLVVPLAEQLDGTYSIDQVPVFANQKYRIHIHTKNGKDYLSEYNGVKITPPIDTVRWERINDGVSIFLSTHDPQNQTTYYQWMFEETWKYHAEYQSAFIFRNDSLMARKAADFVYYCWNNAPSTDIILASTAKLSSDVVSDMPLTTVLFSATDKLSIKYSILVKQLALTKEWYDWKLKIKRNTEQLGSIFDAQPSETGGNIQCVSNPSETVIGFIGCTTETEKRIFIDHSEIPDAIIFSGYGNCEVDTLKDDPAVIKSYLTNPGNIMLDYVHKPTGESGVAITSAYCADCRLKGGSTQMPPFWPN